MSGFVKIFERALGLNQDEIWREFASEIGAEFVPRKSFFSGTCKICLIGEGIDIRLDTYSEMAGESNETVTRAISCDIDCQGFSLMVLRRSLWDVLKSEDKFYGNDNWEILHKNGFLLKTNDGDRAMQLIAVLGVMEVILHLFKIRSELKIECGDFDDNNLSCSNKIVFTQYGVVRQKETLMEIFDLLTKTALFLKRPN